MKLPRRIVLEALEGEHREAVAAAEAAPPGSYSADFSRGRASGLQLAIALLRDRDDLETPEPS